MKPKYLILAILLPVVVILDQITKIAAKSSLRPLVLLAEASERYITVIDGFFRLKYAENPGAAWGIGATWSPGLRVTFFIVVAIAAIVFILYYFHKLEPGQRLLAAAFSCVLGGAVGNLIDRIYMGKVVDFIDWYVSFDEPVDLGFLSIAAGEHHWPTFNIADIGITCGVALLILDMLVAWKRGAAKDAD